MFVIAVYVTMRRKGLHTCVVKRIMKRKPQTLDY